MNRVGCFVLDKYHIASAVAVSLETAQEAIEALVDEGRIAYDPDTRLMLVIRHFRHNAPENPNVAKAAARDDVPNLPFNGRILTLLKKAVEHYLPAKTKEGKPFCEVISEAVRKRLQDNAASPSADPFGNPSPKGTTEGSANPLGTEPPIPEPEPEPEPEPITTASSSSLRSSEDEASPRRFGIMERADFCAKARPLIQKRWWQGKEPPEGLGDPRRPWGISRELDIACQWVAEGSGSAEDILRLLRYGPVIYGFRAEQSLKWLNARHHRHRLYEGIDEARKLEEKSKQKAPGPSPLSAILAEAVGHAA